MIEGAMLASPLLFVDATANLGGLNMQVLRFLASATLAAALVSSPGCGSGMSMTDQLDQMARHEAELRADLASHHDEVLMGGDAAMINRAEDAFGPRADSHMGEMDHRMRDMQTMCAMGGRAFDGEAMADVMARLRAELEGHHPRMLAVVDLPAMRAEETAFRQAMTPMLDEMRRRREEAGASASRYGCRMHGH